MQYGSGGVIADRLHLSEGTVKVHLERDSRHVLTVYARERGLA